MSDTKALITVARGLLARPKDFCGRDVMADLVEALEAAEAVNTSLRALVAALDERKNAERHLARMEDIDGYRAFVGRGRAARLKDAKARLRKANKAVVEARRAVADAESEVKG